MILEQMPKIVSVYKIHVGELFGRAEEILKEIPQGYRERYQRIRIEEERLHALGAGFLLRRCLGIREDGQLSYNEYGKPSLKDSPVEFNISHSGEYVVMAIAEEPVGIDIEKVGDVMWEAAGRVFPKQIADSLRKMDENAAKLGMATYWTRTEAILKALGTGFGLEPGENPECMENWCCQSILIDRKYMITCAMKESFLLSFGTCPLL